MTRLQELEQKYTMTKKLFEELKKEYSGNGKIKGMAYTKRHMQIVEKQEKINSEVLLYGTQGNIILIEGDRNRIGKKNPQIRIKERFKLYLVNVHVEDVPKLITMRYPNVINYTISQLKPGSMIISR